MTALGYTITRVSNILKQNFILPLCYVDLRLAENINIINILSLFDSLVTIENPYKVNRGPHSLMYTIDVTISRPPAILDGFAVTIRTYCTKCSENHLVSGYSKDISNLAKFALCGGDHTANFKGCLSFKSLYKYQSSVHRISPKPKSSNPLSTNLSPNPQLTSYKHFLSDSENNNNNVSVIQTLLTILSLKLLTQL